ncbi:MAG: serine protease Do [Clostridiales bacterium]|jgi:serine protease Do|nr:serine protease Do [Clostridiales bacterium]
MIYRTKKATTLLLLMGIIGLSLLSGAAGAYLASKFGTVMDNGLHSDDTDNAEFSYSYDNTGNNNTLQQKNTGVVQETSKPADTNNSNTEATLNTAVAKQNTGNGAVVTTGENNSTRDLTIPEIASIALKSVVEITTETVQTGSRMRQYISQGAGSGVIITQDGYIVTNHHVIEGASRITVTTSEGRNYTATLVGTDKKTDLAVIKIDAEGLQPAVFGNSDELVVGELAVVVGNPLGELGGTVTEGIISALNRDIIIDGEKMNLLQTSAAINPGNSGGGLFNSRGQLIGIVNAKSSGLGIEGLGFAIPINTVKEVVQQIMTYGYVRGRVDLGVTLIDVTDIRTALMYRLQNMGVYVLEVTDEDSLFQPGDRIVSIDGVEVESSDQVEEIIQQHKVGDVLDVVIQRGRRLLQVRLVLKEAKG